MRIRFVSVLVAMMIIFSGMVILTDDAESFTIRLAGPNSTYKTIQDAIDASGDKDVIIVENGTYYESVTINTKNIILIGNSTTDCKIIHHHDGTDSSTDYAAGINITASGVTVTGFNITTTGNYTYGISIRSATTLHVNIMNNNITTISLFISYFSS